MAYHIEKGTGDIIFNGWEKGIAGSPHKGVGNLQCANITTVPGEVMCNFGRIRQTVNKTLSAYTLSGLTSSTLTANAGTELLVGVWINVTATTITGLSTGYYYVRTNTSGVITVSTLFEGSAVTGLGTTGSATFTLVTMGKPIAWTYDDIITYPSLRYWLLDNNGVIWTQTFSPSTVGYASTDKNWRCVNGNGIATSTTSGIAVYGSYLLLPGTTILYYHIGTIAQQQSGASNFATTANLNTTKSHITLHGHDEVIYIADGTSIASLTVVAGHDADYFDPTNSATYTFATAYSGGTPALQLPLTETISALAEIGTNLMIGCWSKNLYQWNRSAIPIGNGQSISSFFYPIILPENFVSSMVTVNNLVYIFCGTKGNIYITNGSTISPVLTIPDSVTAQIEPYYIWGATMYLRGRIWFSVQDSNSKTGGVWSFVPTQSYFLEQDSGMALRLEAQNSYNTYAGMATVLIPVLEIGSETSLQVSGQQAQGAQYWSAWDDGTSGASSNPYGVDYSDTNPFTGGQTIIETDIVPTGSFLEKKTLSQIEYKLAAPLASGESVTIKYRTDITTAYADLGNKYTETGQTLSGYYDVNFEKSQWVQFQIILTSTNSNPSFVRLVEIRAR